MAGEPLVATSEVGKAVSPAFVWGIMSLSGCSMKKAGPAFGSDDLRLPDELRPALLAHLRELRKKYAARGWGGRVGFGQRPALIVIDLALWWTDPVNRCQGSNVDSVVAASPAGCFKPPAPRRSRFFSTRPIAIHPSRHPLTTGR